MLYIYDGHWTGQLFDETFRVWSPHSVGFGSDAIIFGPQFGKYAARSRPTYDLGELYL
jgi:hypothetical protein